MGDKSNEQSIDLGTQEILRVQFEDGKGVVNIDSNMSDAALLLVIKHAASFGEPFKVFPISIPVDDSHFYGTDLLELHSKLRATGILGPFNK
jgi:hypothetical protein